MIITVINTNYTIQLKSRFNYALKSVLPPLTNVQLQQICVQTFQFSVVSFNNIRKSDLLFNIKESKLFMFSHGFLRYHNF